MGWDEGGGEGESSDTHVPSLACTWACFPAEDDVDPAELVARLGPNLYELYAVLLHSGGALGGHYYAYIKDLCTGKWFNFNDSSVTPITVGDLKSAYGGPSSYGGSSMYQTSANAYMLLYR